MDRFQPLYDLNCPAMRARRPESIKLLLQSGRGIRGELGSDASDRSIVYRAPCNRLKDDDQASPHARSFGQSKENPKADADDGNRGDLPRSSYVQTSPRTPRISLSAQRFGDFEAQSGLGERHYLHSAGARVRLPGCGHGLVQSVRAVVGDFQQPRAVLLRHRSRLGTGIRTARNLQHRPGQSVYIQCLYRAIGTRRDTHQHGRSRSVSRQHLHRAPLANGEVRRDISARLCERATPDDEPRVLSKLLQSRPTSPVLRRPNTRGGLSRHRHTFLAAAVLTLKALRPLRGSLREALTGMLASALSLRPRAAARGLQTVA